MQATVEFLPGLERKISVQIPAGEIDEAVEKRLQEIASKVDMRGFRAGKVPKSLLYKRFGQHSREEVINQFIQSSYSEALTQEKFMPAGPPSIEIIHNKIGEPLEYKASLEVLPLIQVKNFSEAEIKRFTVEINQKDVDGVIQQLRKLKAIWHMVTDRPSQKEDRILISYTAKQNGKPLQDNTEEKLSVELGSTPIISGLEEGLIGRSTSETFTWSLTLPQDYHLSELANQVVDLEITLHQIEKPILPPLDEDLFKEIGEGISGIEELRASVLEKMRQKVKEKESHYLKNQIIEKLLLLNPLDLPKIMVDNALAQLIEEEKNQENKSNKITALSASTVKSTETLLPLAKQRVHLMLLFSELINFYKITADKDQVDKAVQTYVKEMPDPEKIAKFIYKNEQLYKKISDKVIEEQLFDKLIQEAQSIHQSISYVEFTRLNPN